MIYMVFFSTNYLDEMCHTILTGSGRYSKKLLKKKKIGPASSPQEELSLKN